MGRRRRCNCNECRGQRAESWMTKLRSAVFFAGCKAGYWARRLTVGCRVYVRIKAIDQGGWFLTLVYTRADLRVCDRDEWTLAVQAAWARLPDYARERRADLRRLIDSYPEGDE